jgi:hypothetical protein
MKPNGKQFVVRSVLFVLSSILLAIAASNAETAHGTFNLQTETRWGSMLLKPGDYEFTMDLQRTGNVITVRSADSRSIGMILPAALSTAHRTKSSGMNLGYSGGMPYVRSLYLSDIDLQLEFAAPRTAKLTKLARQTDLGTASGTH